MKLRAFITMDYDADDLDDYYNWREKVRESAKKLKTDFRNVRFDVKERRDRVGADKNLPRYRID